jgi:hypothetical protein
VPAAAARGQRLRAARQQHLGGGLQSFDPAERFVLVLDVHGHIRIDAGQGGDEPVPEVLIVAFAEGDEVPGRVLRPGADRRPAADVRDPVPGEARVTVVEDPVDLRGVVDAHVLGRGVDDELAEVVDGGDRVDALPEQVGGIHLRADVRRRDRLDEAFERGRVEHEVVRVHLDGDLHPVVGGEAIEVAPDRSGRLPLSVADVEQGRFPGVDDPGR